MSREMKDSGIEWLGYIPQNWDVDRIKRAISSIKGGIWGDEAVGDENDVDCVRIADFDRKYYRVGDVYFTKRNVPLLKQKDYLLKYGDLIIEKSGGGEKTPVGFVALYDKNESAVYSNFTAKLTVNQNEANSNFMRYLFAALYEQGISFRSIKQTTGIQNIDLKAYLDEKIGYPNIESQKKIAKKIDFKVTEINSLIEKTKSTIEDYKLLKQSIITEAVTKGLDKNVEMNESGIEWVGFMPAHWDILRGKVILNKLSRPVLESDKVVTCFRDGEVTLRSNRREDGFTMADKEIGYQGIESGDLVVHGMDGFAGAIGISDSRGKSSPVLNVLDSNQNKDYIMFYLRSMAISDVFIALATGIRVRSCDLRWNKIGDLPYPIPPIEEQRKIVEHVKNNLQQINDLIEKKQSLLVQLECYKNSLIYEYVTGKRDVI